MHDICAIFEEHWNNIPFLEVESTDNKLEEINNFCFIMKYLLHFLKCTK